MTPFTLPSLGHVQDSVPLKDLNPSRGPLTRFSLPYLDRTKAWTSGPLLHRGAGGTLTTEGIKQQILYFIEEADSDSVPKAHYIRKLATSLNFFHHMDFEALTSFTGWKPNKVFFKHYLKNIEALSLPTVAAGKVNLPSTSIHSGNEESD